MPRGHPNLLQRSLAALCAAVVFGLTLLAASPAAHEWVHSHEASHTCPDHPEPASSSHDHRCAIVFFAAGVETPVAAITLVPPRFVTRDISPVTAAEIYLVSPRYLRQPERGPPTHRVA